MKCINSIEPAEPTFKERVERVEQFEKMLINLGIRLDKDKDVAIAREWYKSLNLCYKFKETFIKKCQKIHLKKKRPCNLYKI